MGKAFKSTHKLDFLVAPWEKGLLAPVLNLQRYKIGTVEGLWGHDDNNYFILAITNTVKGNGSPAGCV